MLLLPALALLLLAITESARWGPTSPAILGSLTLSVVLLAMFIRQEHRAPAPLIDLTLFRSISFATGIVGVVLSYAMLYAILFLMSFAFIRGFHDTPLAAGMRLAIVPLALGIVAPFTGWLQDRLGVRTVLCCGMAVCVAGLLLLSDALTGTAGNLTGAMVALGVYGAGLGLFIAPNNSATMSAAPRERSGQAGGLLNLLRMFGTSLGVAGAAALLSSEAGGQNRQRRPNPGRAGYDLVRQHRRGVAAADRRRDRRRPHLAAAPDAAARPRYGILTRGQTIVTPLTPSGESSPS